MSLVTAAAGSLDEPRTVKRAPHRVVGARSRRYHSPAAALALSDPAGGDAPPARASGLRGLHAAGGSVVGAATTLVHMDPAIDPEPDRFRPERLLLGATLARAVLKIVLATLLREFRFRALDSRIPRPVRMSTVTGPSGGVALSREHGPMTARRSDAPWVVFGGAHPAGGDARRRDESAEPVEVARVAREHDVSAAGGEGHHDGVDRGRPRHARLRLAGGFRDRSDSGSTFTTSRIFSRMSVLPRHHSAMTGTDTESTASRWRASLRSCVPLCLRRSMATSAPVSSVIPRIAAMPASKKRSRKAA